MRFEILGKEPVDYISKRTGQPVKGTRLHCINLENQKVIEGQAVENMFVKELINCADLHVGDKINVYYNQYGSVDDIRLV